MQVIRAEAMGLCFGVRDALESIAAVPDPHHVTVYGELVHNQEVNRRLAERGFRQLTEHSRKQAVPETPVVLITAHGISNEERARLESTGRRLLDTTCPCSAETADPSLHSGAARGMTGGSGFGWFYFCSRRTSTLAAGTTSFIKRPVASAQIWIST